MCWIVVCGVCNANVHSKIRASNSFHTLRVLSENGYSVRMGAHVRKDEDSS